MPRSRALLGFTFLGTTVAAILALFWFWNKKDQDEPNQTRQSELNGCAAECSRTQNGTSRSHKEHEHIHETNKLRVNAGPDIGDPGYGPDFALREDIDSNGGVHQDVVKDDLTGSLNDLKGIRQPSSQSREDNANDNCQYLASTDLNNKSGCSGVSATSETATRYIHPIERSDYTTSKNCENHSTCKTTNDGPVIASNAGALHAGVQNDPATCQSDAGISKEWEDTCNSVPNPFDSNEAIGLETDAGPTRNRDFGHIYRGGRNTGNSNHDSRTLTSNSPPLHETVVKEAAKTSFSMSGLSSSQIVSSHQTVNDLPSDTETETIPYNANTSNDLDESQETQVSQNSVHSGDENAAVNTECEYQESVEVLVHAAVQQEEFAEVSPSRSHACSNASNGEQIPKTLSESSTELLNNSIQSPSAASPIDSENNVVSCQTKSASLVTVKDDIIESVSDQKIVSEVVSEKKTQSSPVESSVEVEHTAEQESGRDLSVLVECSVEKTSPQNVEGELTIASSLDSDLYKHLSDLGNSKEASLSLDSLEQSPEPESQTEAEDEQRQSDVGLSTSSTISEPESLLESQEQPPTSHTVCADVLNTGILTGTAHIVPCNKQQNLPENDSHPIEKADVEQKNIEENCDIGGVECTEGTQDTIASASQTSDTRERSQSAESGQSRDSLEPVTETSIQEDVELPVVNANDSGVELPQNDNQTKSQPPGKSEGSATVPGYNCDNTSEASNDSGKGASVSEPVLLPQQQEFTICELDFPSDLCGRLIGRRGKNINYIKDKSGATVTLRNNPYTPEYQICSIEGLPSEIEEALKLIQQKFPKSQFPNVNISPNNANVHEAPIILPDVMQMNLPHGVSVDVMVSSIVNAGHIFLQQLTHPTFPSLERLNQFMAACYTQDHAVPQLPKPIEGGVICAAPMMAGWYRAQVVDLQDDTDEVDIKFVDYGGYSRLPSTHLRQIRSDFMTLPFQAVECYMANVTTNQGEMYFNGDGTAVLEELTQGKLLQAQVVGRADDGVPFVHIYQVSGNKALFVNREMVNRGVARWIEQL